MKPTDGIGELHMIFPLDELGTVGGYALFWMNVMY